MSADADTTQQQLDQILGQVQKLSRITRLISEGHFFLYHPQPGHTRADESIQSLAESFNEMIKKLREAREDLENKVEQRMRELKDKAAELERLLDEVQTLKLQQDGDFFLTSLLLDPLGANRSASENVSIEFHVEQKKTFQFKKKTGTIGGDICGADSIVLHGRPCTVFFNADAMGKSIQGAAGALVLGAVFDAIVERTRLSEAQRDQFPEVWLRESFVQIQKVFESFECTMLISMLFGVVDERSGALYYYISDYPHPVLIRDGVYSFVEPAQECQRVGMRPNIYNPGGKNFRPLTVQMLQLQPGDALLSGSDGRDDIETDVDENGQRIINQNADRFLNIVRQSGGRLAEITARLKKVGKLADDLSLMRLEYRPKGDLRPRLPQRRADGTGLVRGELRERYRQLRAAGDLEGAFALLQSVWEGGRAGTGALRKLAALALRLGKYDAAQRYGELAHEYMPLDSDILLLLSRVCAKNGDLELAMHYGERARIRRPLHPQTLKNLIHISRALGRDGKMRRFEEHLEIASLAEREAAGAAVKE